MNSKSLGILVGILAVVIVGVLATHLMNKGSIEGSSKKAGGKVLEGLNPDNVKAITIENKEHGTTLELGDNKWTVKDRDNYPAKFSEVRDVIWKIWELSIVEGINAGASTHGRFNLVKPGTEGADEDEIGTVVAFKGAGNKDLGTLVIGKDFEGAPKEDTPSPFPGFQMGEKGTFVWSPASPDKVWRVKEDFMGLKADPADWLETDFISGNSIKSVEVTHPDGETWKVFREAKGGTLALADPKEGEEFDTSKGSSSGNAFASPRFQDVLPAAQKDQAGLDGGTKAKIETFEGFTYNVTVGDEVGGESNSTDRYLTFTVDYQQPEEPKYEVEIAAKFPPSTAPEGETEEDKKKREEADQSKRDAERKRLEDDYKSALEEAKEKLEKEKAFEGTIYIVTNSTVSGLLKQRSELLKDKEEENADSAPETSSAVTPPVMVPGTGGATAVTPPVRVEIPQPEGDDVSQPEEGNVPQPEEGDVPQPEEGDVPQPEEGDVPQPEEGDVPQPEEGDVPQPEEGDVPQPEEGDVPQPEEGDVPQPEEGDVSQPEGGDASQPEEGDASQPEEADVSQPEEGDASKTVGEE